MKKLFFITATLLISLQGHAFVENTVHGYANCMACHIAPTGGGILTDYGRSLSSELMSTFKTKNFQNPFYGLAKNTPTIKWGGQIRQIQTRTEDNGRKRGQSFLMQNNLEAAAYVKDFVFVGAVGTNEGPESFNPKKGEFLSERHYVLWNVDNTVRVKAGKFRQTYGLNDPNHARLTKTNLQFGSQSETYGLELFKFFEEGEVVLSTSLGRIDIPDDFNTEKNVSLQATHYLGGKSRLTGNVLLGESERTRRALLGVNGVFPILNKKNLVRFELDYQMSQTLTGGPKPEKEHGIFGNILVGRKLFQGMLAYFIYEHAQTDLRESRQSLTTSPGLGFQWLPIAHVELQFEHQYRTIVARNNPEHRSFLMLHLYH
jgi:hypothetical protein